MIGLKDPGHFLLRVNVMVPGPVIVHVSMWSPLITAKIPPNRAPWTEDGLFFYLASCVGDRSGAVQHDNDLAVDHCRFGPCDIDVKAPWGERFAGIQFIPLRDSGTAQAGRLAVQVLLGPLHAVAGGNGNHNLYRRILARTVCIGPHASRMPSNERGGGRSAGSFEEPASGSQFIPASASAGALFVERMIKGGMEVA